MALRAPSVRRDDALGGKLEGKKSVRFDEKRCLNVTVSVPKILLEGERELGGRGKWGEREGIPVLVHVHGGGPAL
jgi:hypothetical protein